MTVETYVTFDEAKRVFADEEEAAVREWTCFCRCGCRVEGVAPVTRINIVAPSLCKACAKKGLPRHDVATAATVWNDMEDEAEDAAAAHPAQVAPTPAPVVVEHPVATVPHFWRQLVDAFMDGFRKGAGIRKAQEGQRNDR